MIEWIVSNIATIIISGVLVAIVAGAIAVMINNKKKGRCISCNSICHDCGKCCRGSICRTEYKRKNK